MTTNGDLNAASSSSAHRRRETHLQTLDVEALTRTTPPFNGAQFVAHLSPGDITFLRNGGMAIRFHIPPEFVDEALSMRNAALTSAPLSIDCQIWGPYNRAG